MRPRLLDAHALIRSDDPARYPFDPLGAPLEAREREQGMTAMQLLDALDACGVERAVLVQRGRLYGYDNRYVCDSAGAYPGRLQYVCQVDTGDAGAARQASEWLRRGAAGLRFMEPVKGDSLAWLDGEPARQAWRVGCEAGVPLSVHFFPWNRRAGLAVLAARLAELPPRALVLDSLAGINADAGPPDCGVDEALRAVMDFPGARIKLTAMALARLAPREGAASALVAHLAACFGAERMLWGTDVLAPGQSYVDAADLVLAASVRLSAGERAQPLHGTAAALYPLR